MLDYLTDIDHNDHEALVALTPRSREISGLARTNRGHRHPHAVRIVARAWLHVIWRCWQDHRPYDPAHHRALQAVLHEPGSSAEVTATQMTTA